MKRKRFVVSENFVRDFFKKKGYKIIKIFSTGRSFVGKTKKGNKKFFFKFPQNEYISRRVRNEYVWNKKLNLLSVKNNWPIYFLKVYDSGTCNKIFWFITECLNTNDVLADPVKATIVLDFVDKYLDKTIDFLFILPKIKIRLPNDTAKDFPFSKCKNPKNVKPIIRWAVNLAAKQGRFNVKEIIKIINETNLGQVCVNHTDYKPWHFFKYKNKIALIDAENANSYTPIHYDVASYYTRMITVLNREDIANIILKKYYKRVDKKDEFMQQFRAIVGWIAAGEMRDAILKKRITKGNYLIFKKIKRNNFLD